MSATQLKVQARRNTLSRDWYDVTGDSAVVGWEDAPEDWADEVARLNREYGWQKFRITPDMTGKEG